MWILWPWYGNWFVVISTYLPHERSLLYYLQFHDMDRALGFPLFWQLIMGASKVMSLDKPTISCRKCAKSRALVMESFISHSRPLDGPPQAQEARPRPRPLLRLWGRGRLRDRRADWGAGQAGAAQAEGLPRRPRLQARQERRHHQEHAQLRHRRVRTLHDDTSGCFLGFVDIKIKVVF